MGVTPERQGGLLSGSGRVHLLVVLLVLAGGWIHYYPAAFAPFDFDDQALIVANPTIRDFRNIPTVLASGRPVRGLTLMVDYALFGLDPKGYHLHNVLWHLSVTLLFYSLVFRLFRRRLLAVLATALFIAHPVHNEALMSISHRKDLLAMAFMLLGFHAYLYRSRRPVLSYLAVVVCLVLAMTSKQVAVVLPLLLAAHWWSEKKEPLSRRTILGFCALAAVGVIPFIGGLIWSGPLLRDFNLFGLVSPIDLDRSGYSRLMATSFSVYPRHFSAMLFPVHLTAAPRVDVADWSMLRPWLGVALFAALILALVRTRKNPVVFFSLAWVFVNLLPFVNWIPASFFFAERYLYIPSAGVCLLGAWMMERVYYHEAPLFPREGGRLAEAACVYLLAVVALLFGISMRVAELWPEFAPHRLDPAMAVGIGCLASGLLGAAILHPLTGVRGSRLLDKRAWLDLVIVYITVGVMFAAAILITERLVGGGWRLPDLGIEAQYRNLGQWIHRHARPGPREGSGLLFPSGTSLTILVTTLAYLVGWPALYVFVARRITLRQSKNGPNRALALSVFFLLLYSNLSADYTRVMDWTSAPRLWKTAIMEDPQSPVAWNNLGKAYMDRKKYRLAAEAFTRAALLEPDVARPHRNLGMALLAAGDLGGAADAFRKAVDAEPQDVYARINLANILVVRADKGDDPDGYEKAVPHYFRVLEHDPRSAHARYNLAYCYFRMDALDEAQRQLMEALRLNPSEPKYRALYEMVQEARAGKEEEVRNGWE